MSENLIPTCSVTAMGFRKFTGIQKEADKKPAQ
jgi:hypothetical protein